jgi:prepilin-type N-terminal cleavage/methylation domain-containing protein
MGMSGSNKKAMTLIELLIVITVLAIVGGLGLPMIGNTKSLKVQDFERRPGGIGSTSTTNP